MTPRPRRRHRGLRKRCDCKPSKWPQCRHHWFANFGFRGHHYRVCLDRHVGERLKTKADAQGAADDLRAAIRAGRYGAHLPAQDVLTLEQLLAAYVKDYVTPERPRSLQSVQYQVGVICRTVLVMPTGERRAFGRWLVADLTTGALEHYRKAARVSRLETVVDADGRTRHRRLGGVIATNRALALLRACVNWALRLGYLHHSPFTRHGQPVVKLSKETARHRRLEGDEYARLLAACDPVLKNPKTKEPFPDQPTPRLGPLVRAAVESGCRLGELLSLQWHQVRDLDGPRPALILPAGKTKTGTTRTVPISTPLRALLEMRRHDPAGTPWPPGAYVFGDALGTPIRRIHAAWTAACTRAKITGLHFHDLRREAGSRWIEGGVPLQTIQRWLGHTNVSQTSTYLATTVAGTYDAMQRFDAQRADGAVQDLGKSSASQRLQAAAPADVTSENAPKSVN